MLPTKVVEHVDMPKGWELTFFYLSLTYFAPFVFSLTGVVAILGFPLSYLLINSYTLLEFSTEFIARMLFWLGIALGIGAVFLLICILPIIIGMVFQRDLFPMTFTYEDNQLRMSVTPTSSNILAMTSQCEWCINRWEWWCFGELSRRHKEILSVIFPMSSVACPNTSRYAAAPDWAAIGLTPDSLALWKYVFSACGMRERYRAPRPLTFFYTVIGAAAVGKLVGGLCGYFAMLASHKPFEESISTSGAIEAMFALLMAGLAVGVWFVRVLTPKPKIS